MAQARRSNGEGPTPRATELLKQTEWVRALARVVARDVESADDLAQETMVAALAGSPPEGVALRLWLARTVRNLARLGRRGDVHRCDREREVARPERAEDHARVLAEAEAHSAVVGHVLALDECDREVLLARYFQCRSPAEIARREGRSVAAVSSQLTRAHRNLRARLEASGGRERWLAGIAPLLERPARFGSSVGAASLALASKWAIGTAVVVVIGAFFGLRGRWSGDPSGGVVSIAPEGSTVHEDLSDEAELAQVVSEPHRTDAVELLAVPTYGDAFVRVVAAKNSQILEGHLWIEEVTGLAVADGALGAEGSVVFPDLPAARALRAFLSVAGTRWVKPVGEFELRPGQSNEYLWTVFLDTRVELVAVDRDGVAAPGQTLGLLRTGARRREFASSVRTVDVIQIGSGDDHGRIAFDGVAAGRYGAGVIDYMLTTERTLADGSRQVVIGAGPEDPGCSITLPIEVPPNTERMEIEVLVHRGQRIAGRVVDGDGNGISDVKLRAAMKGVGGALETGTNEDGSFTFGSVVPGTYSIGSEYSQDGWVLADLAEIESGNEDVLLTLGRAGIVELSVTGADAEDVWVWSARVGPGSTGPRGRGPYDLTGGAFEKVIKGLQPGVHWISAHNASGTRLGVAWPVNVAPGPERMSCTIHLARALEVEVVNHDPAKALSARPDFGEFTVPSGYAAPGDRDIVAVPPGTSTLLLRFDGGAWEPHIVTGAAGERVTVEVGMPGTGPSNAR